MHIYCTGSGSPTIVMDSGLGDDFLSWVKNQPELAKVTRVCSYDRSGLGWSEPRPSERNANAVADELRGLLERAGISGSVVLMGHSLGGLHIRAYASRHPQRLVGLVFVDAATPEFFSKMPRDLVQLQQESADNPWARWMTLVGIPRILGRCGSVPDGYEAYANLFKANDCIPHQLIEIQREFYASEQSCAELEHTGPFPDLEVLVLSRDTTYADPEPPPDLRAEMAVPWNSMQENLLKLSPKSRRIVAKGSPHYIHTHRPEPVNQEVKRLVLEIRGETAPSGYGSTTIE